MTAGEGERTSGDVGVGDPVNALPQVGSDQLVHGDATVRAGHQPAGGTPPRSALRRLKDRLPAPARARAAVLLERAEPSHLLLRGRLPSAPCPPLGVVSVYRARNAPVLGRLITQIGAPTRVACWALDEPTEPLTSRTVGAGGGLRMPLLNRAVEALSLDDDAWLVIADDDVVLRSGTVADLVRAAVQLGLDVAQPSHGAGSSHSWPLHNRRRLTLARSTRFVETGPLLVMSPQARATCLPFPDELGMGWGSEVEWATRLELRTGIVDAITMVHTGRVAGAYDASGLDESGGAEGRRRIRAAGYADLADLQREDGRWRAWQRRPDWADPRRSGLTRR